ANAYCSAGGTCVGDLAQGVACTAGCQCTTGNCVDGMCCNTACNSTCSQCIGGVCNLAPPGTDPHKDCGAYQCDGTGACYVGCNAGCDALRCKPNYFCNFPSTVCVPTLPPGSGCTLGCQCQSGMCVGFPNKCN